MSDNNHPKLILKLMVVITDRTKTKKLTEIFREEHVDLLFMFSGIGSANSEILDVLGLAGSEKAVTLCIAPAVKVSALMKAVVNRMDFRKPGKGIAFSIPLSSVSSPIQNLFCEKLMQLEERWTREMEKSMDKELRKIKEESTHDLIVAVINSGFSGELMDAARSAGAGGGTIVNARRISEGDIVKFFGVPLQEEKEVVVILIPREKKKEIMQEIAKSCGMRTEARGIVFSMHCDTVAGLHDLAEDTEE